RRAQYENHRDEQQPTHARNVQPLSKSHALRKTNRQPVAHRGAEGRKDDETQTDEQQLERVEIAKDDRVQNQQDRREDKSYDRDDDVFSKQYLATIDRRQDQRAHPAFFEREVIARQAREDQKHVEHAAGREQPGTVSQKNTWRR